MRPELGNTLGIERFLTENVPDMSELLDGQMVNDARRAVAQERTACDTAARSRAKW